jgi:colanic acid/amylovoran biosynthesis glycosyltransferase
MNLHLPAICIYRSDILPLSETFIPAQVEALRRYRPVYLGCRKVLGIELPKDKTRVISKGGAAGRVRELAFKLTAGAVPNTGIAALQPKLVHAHFGTDAVDVLRLVKQMRVPLLFTAHGSDFTERDEEHMRTRKGARFVRRRDWLAQDASRAIAISRYVANAMVARGIPERKIVVHYIGVDTRTFTPGPGGVTTPLVLFVGRLIEKKGCEYAIRAVAEVQEAVPGVELVVIGDGPLRAELEVLAARCLRRYSFIGGQSNAVVCDWMRRAAVFCTPSITEGLGIVFLEAQAMGIPVVSFASGGIPEAVAHGVTGLLAPERDIPALASNLLRLLTDRPMRQCFSEAAVRHVRENFDLQKQTALLEDVYDDVIRDYTSTHSHD